MNRPIAHRRLAAVFAAVAFGVCAPPAQAVIIDTTTGTGNTSAPTADPGWANVGVRGIGTGVYLGNRWVLTASHVGAGGITLSGTTYVVQAGSQFQLNNAGAPGKTAFTDLVMFRLTADPGLPAISIASSTPTNGSAVTMIGSGLNRGAFTTWLVNTSTTPWVWTPNNVNPNAAGYQYGSGRTMRWGTNTTSGTGWVNAGYGDSNTFITTFDYLGGPSTEAQAATGDSGGGVFRKNGSAWELAGLMLAVDAYDSQPANTAVYGNNTFIADLSYYRPQIMAVVPEPATAAPLAVGVVALVWWRRRRRAA